MCCDLALIDMLLLLHRLYPLRQGTLYYNTERTALYEVRSVAHVERWYLPAVLRIRALTRHCMACMGVVQGDFSNGVREGSGTVVTSQPFS